MSNSPTANKGEWSELYVLFKIFQDRAIQAADVNLNPLEHQYNFLKVFRDDTVLNRRLVYHLDTPDTINITATSGETVKTISSTDLPEKTQKIFEAIKEANSSSFSIDSISELMSRFEITKIKASSSEKSDIEAIIEDRIATSDKPVGFSIKSQIGGASTLLNASQHTNFIYKINNFSGNINEINAIDGSRKIRDRLASIFESGASLEFSSVNSQTFSRNLRLIDTFLPNLLSEILIDYYLGRKSSIPDLCTMTGEKNLHEMGETEVSFKIKNFLRSIALGMVPSKEWNTYLSTYGGYIVVRSDGLLVCYHLYNDDDFKDYLFRNTKLDTPSSSRHGFGSIYKKDGQPYINLNLQIRFTS